MRFIRQILLDISIWMAIQNVRMLINLRNNYRKNLFVSGLISNGFQGKDGQQIPDMDVPFIDSVSERYIELYEHITGDKFIKADATNVLNRVENNILDYLS